MGIGQTSQRQGRRGDLSRQRGRVEGGVHVSGAKTHSASFWNAVYIMDIFSGLNVSIVATNHSPVAAPSPGRCAGPEIDPPCRGYHTGWLAHQSYRLPPTPWHQPPCHPAKRQNSLVVKPPSTSLISRAGGRSPNAAYLSLSGQLGLGGDLIELNAEREAYVFELLVRVGPTQARKKIVPHQGDGRHDPCVPEAPGGAYHRQINIVSRMLNTYSSTAAPGSGDGPSHSSDRTADSRRRGNPAACCYW